MANLAFKFSFRHQSRLSYVPWIERSSASLCLKSSDNGSSSFPVRYVPKKSSKVNEPKKSLPIKDSKKKMLNKSLSGVGRTLGLDEEAQTRKQMYEEKFISEDERQGFEEEINHDVGVIKLQLKEEVKQLIEETRIEHERDTLNKDMQAGKTILDAEKMGIEVLARRAYTTVELRKKLHGKKFRLDIVEALITDLHIQHIAP